MIKDFSVLYAGHVREGDSVGPALAQPRHQHEEISLLETIPMDD